MLPSRRGSAHGRLKSQMRNDRASPQISQRQLRVGEQVRHIIAETLARGHFNNPALANPSAINPFSLKNSLTEVRVSPDLKHASAYVIALGGGDMEVILPALNDEAYGFQKEIARKAKLRFTPKLRFVGDDSFDEAKRIEEVLRDLKNSPPPKGED